MGLFFKKKAEEDELPPLPPLDDLKLPELPRDEEELPELPALPELPELPKKSVSARLAEPSLPQMPELPELRMPDFNVPEMPKMELPRFSAPEIRPSLPVTSAKPVETTVFVKLDKYRDIMNTIDGVRHKLDDLQVTLNRISAIKGKEAEIVQGWNALLSDTKGKIDEVGSKLLKPKEV